MKNFLQKAALASAAALVVGAGVVSNVGAANDNLLGTNTTTPDGVNVATNASTLIRTIITLVIVVAALLTLFYLIMGAIAWITSGGDKGKVEEARNKITAAVIGLLILAAVWAIFQLVLQLAFGGDVKMKSFVDSQSNSGSITVAVPTN